jgi:hypothetical protein
MAADIDAGAAHFGHLDHGRFLAVHGCPLCRREAAATAANGEKIVVFAHASSYG